MRRLPLARGLRAACKAPGDVHRPISSPNGARPASPSPALAVQPAFRAVLLDAAGTLIEPAEPAAQVYLRHAQEHGMYTLTESQVLRNFRAAFAAPWAAPGTRYDGDGRPFWRTVVATSLGLPGPAALDPALFEALYEHYARPDAWALAPGAGEALEALKAAGVRLAVVSNFDSRLRPLLHGLGVGPLFDAMIVSGEVGAEKPNPVLFECALAALGGVDPCAAVVVGDDRRNDVHGGRAVGCHAWLWGEDVAGMAHLAARVLEGAGSDDDGG